MSVSELHPPGKAVGSAAAVAVMAGCGALVVEVRARRLDPGSLAGLTAAALLVLAGLAVGAAMLLGAFT